MVGLTSRVDVILVSYFFLDFAFQNTFLGRLVIQRARFKQERKHVFFGGPKNPKPKEISDPSLLITPFLRVEPSPISPMVC